MIEALLTFVTVGTIVWQVPPVPFLTNESRKGVLPSFIYFQLTPSRQTTTVHDVKITHCDDLIYSLSRLKKLRLRY